MKKILEVKDLGMTFGGLNAIDDLNLHIGEQEIVAIIGPNGAGKTTFFNCVTGIYNPTRGNVFVTSPTIGFREELNGLRPDIITRKGLARTFQNIRLFQNMTVLENVMIGRHPRSSSSIFGAIFRDKRTLREEDEIVDFSHMILKKFGLEKFINEYAKNLPYGEQRRLEIARALATEPFLLLLDEPAAGMNPSETQELDELITQIREEEEISILLIEHDMKLVMNISNRIYVMDYGKLIAEGTPKEIKNNKKVIKAYLGEDVDA